MSVTQSVEKPEDSDGAAPPRPPSGRRAGAGGPSEGRVLNVFAHSFLVAWTLLAAGPLLWVVLSSLRPHADLVSDPFGLPTAIEWENFTNAWSNADIGRYTVNSLIILSGSLTGTMLLGAMAAYVLARFEFPCNRSIYLLFTGGMMFPVFLALVPLFFILNNMGLLNTRQGLIIVYIAYSLPFTIFFLAAFFRTLPGAVQEAATLDGASHTRTFFQIMLPMASPGLISVGIFNFLGQWNQFVLPRVLNVGSEDDAVLPQGLAALMVQQGYEGDWGALYAGVTMAMLPVLVVYVTFQRQVQTGLTAGAVR
ncbi:carbohydrate ABC transporter permease [Streptomyces sp. B6B3]|uniref:carbohydrate ABC transporter permease n=1 Tax=Streptomyces sp. B6B3 TaxID=3153570 RepID=UPI00325D0C91